MDHTLRGRFSCFAATNLVNIDSLGDDANKHEEYREVVALNDVHANKTKSKPFIGGKEYNSMCPYAT
jgi:hypothetical protein